MASVRKREWTHAGVVRSAWVVTYTDATGKRRQVGTFEKKKDADRRRVALEAEVQAGLHVPKTREGTVGALADAFVKHSASRLADRRIGRNRYRQIESVVRLHVAPHFGRKLLNDLTLADIEGWHLHMAPRLSPQTRSNYMALMVEVESYAFRRGLVKRRPFADYRSEFGGVSRVVIKTFTVDQVRLILAEAEIRKPNGRHRSAMVLKCAIHLAAFCGLRRGEIFGLTVDSVDVPNRILRIRHSMTQFNELKAPKTAAGRRDVPMPAHLAAMMQEYLDRYGEANPRNLVFVAGRQAGRQGVYWMQNLVSALWHPLLRRAGLQDQAAKDYHFHALRHFAASWMIEQRISLPDVAALLGHKKFDMTLQVYAHPIVGGNHRHAAFDRMAGTLLPA